MATNNILDLLLYSVAGALGGLVVIGITVFIGSGVC